MCQKSCGFHGFCWEFCYYLNCYSSQRNAPFHWIQSFFFFFFHFHYSWYGFLSVHLASWQYNPVCFTEFTNYLAILSSSILLAPPAFVLFFCRRIYNIACVLYESVIAAWKSVGIQASTCVLASVDGFFSLTSIVLEFDMSAIFKCLGYFDSPVRRLLVLGHPVS